MGKAITTLGPCSMSFPKAFNGNVRDSLRAKEFPYTPAFRSIVYILLKFEIIDF